jgi:hypothetical protein
MPAAKTEAVQQDAAPVTAATVKARILDDELRALGLSIGPERCEAIITAIEQRFSEHCNSRPITNEEAEAISRRGV